MEIPPSGQRKNAFHRRKRRNGPSRGVLAALFFAAVLSVPALAATLRTLRLSIVLAPDRGGSAFGLPAHVAAFLAGGMAFAALYAFVRVPARCYVLVHETTHAVFALLCGSRVSRLRVDDEMGSVDVARPNALILLSPYFFPLPCACVLLAFGLASLAFPMVGSAAGTAFAAIAGLAWGFHFCFTLNALLQRQTDLDAYGFFFSLVAVLLLNVAFLLVCDVALGPAVCSSEARIVSETFPRSYAAALDALCGRL